ncbi:hypothetical protein [Providencia rettgeri]|uniref:MuF-C-terminal domain-containing protein n=1 Tax=Providencia rettgeri TaxID=587 RepID=UPI0023AB4255|nr:hypothetical protein [Providencia rettgeri]
MISEYDVFTSEMARWIQTEGMNGSIEPKDMRRIVSIGRFSPCLLQSIGCNDLEIVTTISIIEKMIFDHAIGIDFLSTLHTIICTPKQIFRSASRSDSVVVITFENQRGNPIIIPIQLNKEQAVGKNRVHWISSVYAKDNPNQLGVWEQKGLLLWDSNGS